MSSKGGGCVEKIGCVCKLRFVFRSLLVNIMLQSRIEKIFTGILHKSLRYFSKKTFFSAISVTEANTTVAESGAECRNNVPMVQI